MMTGLYPITHGVRWNGDHLRGDFTTLAEQLTEEGWNTAAFVSHKAMLTRGGIHQGFQTLSDPVNPEGPPPGARSAEAVNNLAFEFLDSLTPEARQSENFLWLHYFTPHSPYPLTDYAEEKMVDYEGPLKDGATTKEFFDLCKAEHQSPQAFEAAWALYEGRVRASDDYVGDLLAGLEERGMMENTIIIILSDHGQLLGEHDRTGHGAAVFWEKALEVPFIIVDPRETKQNDLAPRVSVVDLAPTVLELVGLESTAHMQGRSLAGAVRGEGLDKEIYYAEIRVGNPRQARPEGQEDAVAVYHEHYKFVREGDGDKEFLYDLAADPGEAHPIPLEKEKDLVDLLRPLAIHHAAASLETLEDEAGELSDAVYEELAELGYVD